MRPFAGVTDAALLHAEAIRDRLTDAARVRARDYAYGWRTARDFLQVAGSGATLWLLWKRKRLAVPVSVATAAVTAALSTASAAFDVAPLAAAEDERAGTIDDADALERRDRIVNAVLDSAPSVLGSALLLASPVAQRTLTKGLDLTPRDPTRPFTILEHARNAGSLYATYSLVGHWLEMAFCQLIRLGIVGGEYDRSNTMLWDWWLHPFPAEGTAGLIIAAALSPLRERLLEAFGGRVAPALAVSFVANQLACTSIDYLTGMVANRNYELWDYRDMPFNFQGQVCLQNSLVYTTAATLATWVAYPARDRWLRRLPKDVADLGFAAMAPAYVLLSLVYFV